MPTLEARLVPHAELLPREAAMPWLTPRRMVIAAGAITPALMVTLGYYPAFDGGDLCAVLAVTTLGLSGFLTILALRIQRRFFAAALTSGVAIVFGFLNTIIPAFLLTAQRGNGRAGDAVFALIMGFVFGAPVGFTYGLGLSVLVALGHPGVHHKGSLVAVDRSRLFVTGWIALILLPAIALDPFTPHRAIPLACGAFVLASSLFAASSAVRLLRRSRWTQRVLAGADPLFRARRRVEGDPEDLIQLAPGNTVVEWLPTAHEPIYRTSGAGVPIAIVADP